DYQGGTSHCQDKKIINVTVMFSSVSRSDGFLTQLRERNDIACLPRGGRAIAKLGTDYLTVLSVVATDIRLSQ
ncbi:MAG: hypothetical protein ACK496_07545, partial [Acidobacteriota bacterium]